MEIIYITKVAAILFIMYILKEFIHSFYCNKEGCNVNNKSHWITIIFMLISAIIIIILLINSPNLFNLNIVININ